MKHNRKKWGKELVPSSAVSYCRFRWLHSLHW